MFLNYINFLREEIRSSIFGYKRNRIIDTYKTLPEINYPSYKSMDEFIDCSYLTSIDNEIKQGIQKYIKYISQINHTWDDRFYSGPFKLNIFKPHKSSPRYIPLTLHNGNYTYFDLDNSQRWVASEYCNFFPSLMKFINTLPFKETARIMIIFDVGQRGVTPHRDHDRSDICHQFIWFRSNLDKKLFVYCPKSKVRKYISSYSAWFDTVNQYHGESPIDTLTFSIRVDGIFNESLLARIPSPSLNLASTPSYWSMLTDRSKLGREN